MNNLDLFIAEQFKHIPHSEQKENLIKDIKQNLEEKVLDLMNQGANEAEAIHKAIIEFGDMEDLKKELGPHQPDQKSKALMRLGFSICGSILIIAFFLFLNFYYSPKVIWFVYPTFAVLWWPLVMTYRWYSIK